ncbi:MAG TPA: MarR family transcriptional regulator [Gemmatimonadaceae bacterium]|nr:MarR family transcriptional regulator [Gemmatimonadaceae bacterium]
MNDFQGAVESTPSAALADTDSSILLSLITAAHAIEEKLEAELAAAGLSGARLRILTQLANTSKPLAFSELAESHRCVRSNITQIIDRLETEGLVRRVDDPVDGRVVRAQLTARGRERQERGEEVFRAIQAEITATIPPMDRESLERALAALNGQRNTSPELDAS